MELLDFTAEMMIRSGKPPIAARRTPTPVVDVRIDDLFFLASAAALLAMPLASVAASWL